MDTCPCGSNLAYAQCCYPVIKGEATPATAEQVMRARYSAYVRQEIEYILTSLHPAHRADYDVKSTRAWAENAEWHKFEVLEISGGGPEDSEGQVEFVVTYTEKGIRKEYHELATFKKEGEIWYFVDGKPVPAKQVVRTSPKIGRNEPCTCGSGKKSKRCCGV